MRESKVKHLELLEREHFHVFKRKKQLILEERGRVTKALAQI